jgi:hypothetical protein
MRTLTLHIRSTNHILTRFALQSIEGEKGVIVNPMVRGKSSSLGVSWSSLHTYPTQQKIHEEAIAIRRAVSVVVVPDVRLVTTSIVTISSNSVILATADLTVVPVCSHRYFLRYNTFSLKQAKFLCRAWLCLNLMFLSLLRFCYLLYKSNQSIVYMHFHHMVWR